MFKASADVMLRPAILDVQGKAVENALGSLGYEGIGHVRIGKHITFDIDAPSREEAERIARDIAERVLSNPIIEDFAVTIAEGEAVAAGQEEG